jgi:hypothetical protein
LLLVSLMPFGAARAVASPIHPASVVLTRTSLSPVAADLGVMDDNGDTSGCQINYHAVVYDQYGQPFSGGTVTFSASPSGPAITCLDSTPPEVDAMVASSSGGTFNITCTATATISGIPYLATSGAVPCQFSAGYYDASTVSAVGSGSGSGYGYGGGTGTYYYGDVWVNGHSLLSTGGGTYDLTSSETGEISIEAYATAQKTGEGGTAETEANGHGQLVTTFAATWMPALGTNPAPPGYRMSCSTSGTAGAYQIQEGTGDGTAEGVANNFGVATAADVSAPSAGYPAPDSEPPDVTTPIWLAEKLITGSTASITATMKATSDTIASSGSNVGGKAWSGSYGENSDAICEIRHIHYDHSAPLNPPPAE